MSLNNDKKYVYMCMIWHVFFYKGDKIKVIKVYIYIRLGEIGRKLNENRKKSVEGNKFGR